MEREKQWQLELAEYIKQGEPKKAERSAAWQAAIGLQDVDGLKTSEYLLATAREHIEGSIDMPIVKRRIESYYQARQNRQQVESETMEADIVSVRIVEILGEQTFTFSPAELEKIHQRLFMGVFDHAGKFRTYNIRKKEWVLNGESVIYASWESIETTLDYDFSLEKRFSYENLSVTEALRHLAGFTSGIWQIHPFCEGNTRTTAVFIIKYLKTFGFQVRNDVFAENAWYFRNALVRANFNDLQKGIHATKEYLERFFENLLIGMRHQLKNRYLHVDYFQKNTVQRANTGVPKSNFCTLDCTLEELAVLRLIAEDPKITQKSLAKITGLSERTIKTRTVALQRKGHLRRANGKRSGHWEVLMKL